MSFLLDKWYFFWYNNNMKTKTTVTIDSAGRFVLPKWIRTKFDFSTGQKIKLTEIESGIILTPELPDKRNFIKNGCILTIDTGAGKAAESDFNVEKFREQNIDKLINENWH